MRRRDFINLFGSAAAAGWPLAARAQLPAKRATIGYLGSNTPSAEGHRLTAFLQRMHDLGWVQGRTSTIEVRWAEGRNERFAEIAAEFARLNVDVIVTAGTAAIVAAKQATSTIPIIFAVSGDPVGTGVVASLARPGGNVTGLSLQAIDLVGKRLELLREAVPGFRRLALLGNGGAPVAVLEMSELPPIARTLGIEVITSEIRRAEDIAAAFELFRERADALYVCADPLVVTNRVRISTFALAARLPTMYGQRENVEVGGLMSYGPSFLDLHRRAADLC